MIEQARERNVHKGHEAAFTIQEIQSEVSTDLVPVVSQELSLSEALHTTRTFSSSARRSGEEGTFRRLSWCTGNNAMFEADGRTPLPAARGWFVDQPDEEELFPEDYELMDAMEQLCDLGKAREVQVEHRDENGGKNRKVPSWELHNVSLFVVCEGVPSKSEMDRDNSERWGVAYGWQPGDDGRSQVRFHCFVKELMDVGYHGVFMANFSSYCTPKIIAALKAQDYVLRFVDQLRTKTGESEPMPFYAYALPIRVSTKTLTAGKIGKSTEIYYPVPAIPHLSQRDPETTLNYLVNMAISEDQAYILEYNGRVEQAIEWSVKESARILAGRDSEIAPREPSSVDNDNPF